MDILKDIGKMQLNHACMHPSLCVCKQTDLLPVLLHFLRNETQESVHCHESVVMVVQVGAEVGHILHQFYDPSLTARPTFKESNQTKHDQLN